MTRALDQSVPLPVATVGGVILLQSAERGGECATFTEGTQAHVDPEHEAVGGRFVQQRDQFTPEPIEVILMLEFLNPALGPASAFVDQ